MKCALFLAVLVFGPMPLALAQQKQTGVEANRIVLGQLANGAEVAFARAGSGDWGIEISGSAVPRETQPKPAQIEVYRGDNNVTRACRGLSVAAERNRRCRRDSEVGRRRQGLICRRGSLEDLRRCGIAESQGQRDRR